MAADFTDPLFIVFRVEETFGFQNTLELQIFRFMFHFDLADGSEESGDIIQTLLFGNLGKVGVHLFMLVAFTVCSIGEVLLRSIELYIVDELVIGFELCHGMVLLIVCCLLKVLGDPVKSLGISHIGEELIFVTCL
jgi:hypothetical protein